jgi:hypothetical protein
MSRVHVSFPGLKIHMLQQTDMAKNSKNIAQSYIYIEKQENTKKMFGQIRRPVSSHSSPLIIT